MVRLIYNLIQHALISYVSGKMLSRHFTESGGTSTRRHFSWQGGTFPGWDKESKPSMTRGNYPPGAVSDDDDEQHLDSSQQGSVREHRLALGDKITLQLERQKSYLVEDPRTSHSA